MPQGPDFIFFLQDKQNRFWGLDTSGNVVINANPYPLEFSPDGWDDIGIKNIRNKRYWAVDRTVSIAFKYVEDAAKILKYIFYTKGVEESVYLTICEQQIQYTAGVGYGFWYKLRFKSEIDLSTYEHNGSYVSCNTLEDGLAKHLKANENTVYEIPMSGAEKFKNDGVILHGNYRWLVLSDTALTTRAIPQMELLPSDNAASGFAVFSVTQSGAAVINDGNLSYICTCIKDTTGIRLRMPFRVIAEFPVATYVIELVKFNPTTGTSTTVPVYSGALVAGTPTDISIDVTFNMSKNDRLFFVSDGAAVTWDETELTIDADTRLDTSYIHFLRPQFLFNELLTRMTNGEYTAEDCPYFGSLKHWNKVFTSGDAIREIDNPKLKISFSQFFDFWDTFDAVGIRESAKKVLLDRKNNLTDNLNLISLGEVSRPVLKLDKSFPFNELAIGYPDIKNEQGVLNGKNETNTTFNFSLGTTKTPRKLSKVSPVKTSCYEIEKIRRDSADKTTTDNRSDNDCYAVHIGNTLIAGSGDIPDHYTLDRTYNDYVTGVDQVSSVYNLAFSPKNCLLRGGDFYRSSLYKCENKTLKFISADRNADMSYVNGSIAIVENADVPVGSLDAPFFQPVLISVETDAPVDVLDELDSNPIAGFEFLFEGNIYKFISLENGINPKTNKKQTYQGLSHPDNDLTKLIDFYG